MARYREIQQRKDREEDEFLLSLIADQLRQTRSSPPSEANR